MFVVTLWHSSVALLLRTYYLVATSSCYRVCLRVVEFLIAWETMESPLGRIVVEWALMFCQSSQSQVAADVSQQAVGKGSALTDTENFRK